MSPCHHVFHGRQPGVLPLVIGRPQVPQHLPLLLWTHGPGPAHPRNRCRLLRGGGRTQVPMNEIRNSTGLLLTGWGLLSQRPPVPQQKHGANEKNDANSSKQ